MLRYGIPAYRLPPDLLDQELDEIRALGITIRTSAEVGSLDAFRKNYDAVFLGLGTQRSRLIPIEGVHQSSCSAASISCGTCAPASASSVVRG